MAVLPESVVRELRRCTTPVRAGDVVVGTGFFASPNLVVTASETVRRPDAITVEVDGQRMSVEFMPVGDVAVLRCERPTEHFVTFSDDTEDGDGLISWVYRRDVSEPDSIRLVYRSTGPDQPGRAQLDVGGPDLPIGAPLLNTRTGCVSGLLTAKDGRVTSARSLLGLDGVGPASVHWWLAMDTDALTRGVGEHDARKRRGTERHFRLFDHESIDVRRLFVEPHHARYRVIDGRREDLAVTSVVADCVGVLDEQRLLLITGGYGSGKTMLAKQLHANLCERGDDVLFVEARDVRDDAAYGRLLDRMRARRWGERELYVIVDEFDALLAARQEANSQSDAVLTQLLHLAERPCYHVVLLSREGVRGGRDVSDRVLHFATAALVETERSAVDVVEVLPFRKQEQRRWLERYSIESRGFDVGLAPHHLEEVHKHIVNACRTPLFLYLLAQSFHQQKKFDDLYGVYETFVDRTAQGKFGGPAPQLPGIARHYREFLRSLAAGIAKHAVLRFDDSSVSELLLDPNVEEYSIPDAEIQPLITQFEREYDRAAETTQRQRFEANLLTCYFLEEVGASWRFRDNNVLFFLLAEQHVLSIEAAVDAYLREGVVNAARALEPVGATSLHPIAVDFVLYRLRGLPRDARAERAEVLAEVLGVGDAHGTPLPAVDDDGLARRLALVLYLLTLNHGHHRRIPRLFAELQWLATGAERRALPYQNIVCRSLRDVEIYGARVHGMSLDRYDFSRASLRDLRFEGCSLKRDVRFYGTRFRNVRFDTCDVELDLTEAVGSCRFEDSRVRLVIAASGGLSLEFAGCSIRAIDLQGGGHNAEPVQLRFKACRIERLHVHDLTRGWSEITLDQCTYNDFLLQRSRVQLTVSAWLPPSPKPYNDGGGNVVRFGGDELRM